ncbi:cupin domain-containing protein [Aspergillus undulatus]|uniref:cupin domain-containing protein n=1 Tax=Aspergillus undulatus TaxID=1810928 RepID=UPI003CCDCF92
MSAHQVEPEQYFLSPAPHVPNSKLPILVYRNALNNTSPRNILNIIEPNGWIKGGQWKTYKVPHFHTQCHECYGIIKGGSTYLLGVGPKDPEFDRQGRPYGMKLTVQKGDVFVLPAGICHASLESWDDYEFIGLYPNVSKQQSSQMVDGKINHVKGILESTGHRFDMNYGFKHPEETSSLVKLSDSVPIPPLDPLYGLDGPLPRLWRQATEGSSLRARI